MVVNGKISEWTDVTSGIPQGSVFGPILFVIYKNDMPDDIFEEIQQKRDCDSLQNDLNFMQLWTDIWLLRFHPQIFEVRKNNLVEYSLPDGKRKDCFKSSK